MRLSSGNCVLLINIFGFYLEIWQSVESQDNGADDDKTN